MASSREKLLSLDGIWCVSNGKYLLKDVSFDLHGGELVSIIGPNGAGKSTLVKAISCERPIDRGTIFLNGMHIKDYAPKDRARHMAVLPQANTLSFPYTVAEVIALGRTPHDVPRSTNNAIVRDILQELDLSKSSERIYTTLSSGEKQRVQVARVMAQIWDKGDEFSKILIMDEPLTSLDLKYQKELVLILKKISTLRITIITVMHDINVAMAVSDKILTMKDGEVTCFDSPEKMQDVSIFNNLFNINLEMITLPDHDTNLFF